MKWIDPLFFLFIVLLTHASQTREPLVMKATQQRRMASELRAYHQEKRKTDPHYRPHYPKEEIHQVISVGTPPKSYQFLVETACHGLWMLDKSYAGRNADQEYFDFNQSTSAQKVADSYRGFLVDSNVTGTVFEDVFREADGFERTQQFGVVNKAVHSSRLNPQLPTGFIGYSWISGFHEDRYESTESSYILNLFDKHPHLDRVFTFRLEADNNDETREMSVTTMFGGKFEDYCEDEGVTAQLYDTVGLYPLVFSIASFFFDETEHVDGGIAVVDAGVPTIVLPLDVFRTIHSVLKPDFDSVHGVYTVPCTQAEKLPDFVFRVFSESKYSNLTVSASAFVVDLMLDSGRCAVAFESVSEGSNLLVLGTPFLRHYCVSMNIDKTQIDFLKIKSSSVKPMSVESTF